MSYADQCKGCLCFVAPGYGGLEVGLCLDCRNPEVDEQSEIDAEICAVCALPFDQHDGRELHRFVAARAKATRTQKQEQELEVMRSRGEI